MLHLVHQLNANFVCLAFSVRRVELSQIYQGLFAEISWKETHSEREEKSNIKEPNGSVICRNMPIL